MSRRSIHRTKSSSPAATAPSSTSPPPPSSSSSSPPALLHQLSSSSSSARRVRVPHSSSSIDYSSTLSEFGYLNGFNVSRYLNDYYSRTPIASCIPHQQELQYRRLLAEEQLKSFVSSHYSTLINSNRSILAIENEMGVLTQQVHHFQSAINTINNTTFQYDDERMSKKHRELAVLQLKNKRNEREEELLLEEYNEELRVLIYERKVERAVEIIELIKEKYDLTVEEEGNGRGKQRGNRANRGGGGGGENEVKSSANNMNSIKREMNEKIAQLVSGLIYELKSPSLKRYEQKQLINYLIKLGESERAQSIYLSSRSSSLVNEMKQIKSQGEIISYARELSVLVFSTLQSTALDFLRLFPSSQSMSGVVVWSLGELHHYCSLFTKQIFQSDQSFGKVGKAMKLAFQEAKHMQTKGMNVCTVIASLFTPPLIELINKNYRIVEGLLLDEVKKEEWKVTELWVHEQGAGKNTSKNKGKAEKAKKKSLKLTQSAKYLYDMVRNLLREYSPLVEGEMKEAGGGMGLYHNIANGIIALFERYLLTITQAQKNETHPLSDSQSLSILSNVYSLCADLLPRVNKELKRQFNRPLPELHSFQLKVNKLYDALLYADCQKRGESIIVSVLHWSDQCIPLYANPLLQPENMKITEWWSKVNDYFVELRVVVHRTLSSSSVSSILSTSIEELVLVLYEATQWEKLNFSFGGLLLFLADISFFRDSVAEYSTPKSKEIMDRVMNKTVKSYCSKTRQDEKEIEKHKRIIEKTAETALKQSNTLRNAMAEAQIKSPTASPPTVSVTIESKNRKGEEGEEKKSKANK